MCVSLPVDDMSVPVVGLSIPASRSLSLCVSLLTVGVCLSASVYLYLSVYLVDVRLSL